MLSLKGRYIAVCGPMGSGKTSLTEGIARRAHILPRFEDLSQNPFLRQYYDDPPRWCYHVISTFLVNTIVGAQQIRSQVLQSGLIQDWYYREHFDIYARLVHDSGILSDHEFELCAKLNSLLALEHPRPDLVIVLDAPETILAERLAKRGRPGEQSVPLRYLADMRTYYPTFDEDSIPTLRVDSESTDFVTDDSATNRVLGQILEMLNISPEPPLSAH